MAQPILDSLDRIKKLVPTKLREAAETLAGRLQKVIDEATPKVTGGGTQQRYTVRQQTQEPPQGLPRPISQADLDAEFVTKGLAVDPRDSPEGLALMEQLRLADRNADDDTIFRRARAMLKSGIDIPGISDAKEPLYMLVPSGQPVTPKSPYFFSEAELAKIKAMPNDEIPGYLALPNQSTSPSYDIYRIEPNPEKVPKVFESVIAPAVQGSHHKAGGGIQTLVPNRDLWTMPKKIGFL